MFIIKGNPGGRQNNLRFSCGYSPRHGSKGSEARDTIVLKNTLQSSNITSGFYVICSGGNDVGISEKEITDIKVNVFPNPCYENIVISAPRQNCSVYLTNSLGELILTREINTEKFVNLEIRNLPPSVYILNIEFEGNKVTKKIIKQ
ncbi:MAG: T9SS type A sorting domain-containing protein [Bacteroidia bacterium]